MAYEFSATDNHQVNRELGKIEEALKSEADYAFLLTLYAEPVRPRAGMIVKADGSTWNPGRGEGIYEYSGSAWQKLKYETDNIAVDSVTFQALDAEPAVVVAGMLVYANGTDWDPGSGAGLYFRNGATWVFLG